MASFPAATSEKGVLRNFVSCNFIKKETLAQVFSCEFFEISKNTSCYRTPLVAASLRHIAQAGEKKSQFD